MTKDPVCGMMVDEKSAKFRTEYQGKTYYFCSPGCYNSFNASQAKFAN